MNRGTYFCIIPNRQWSVRYARFLLQAPFFMLIASAIIGERVGLGWSCPIAHCCHFFLGGGVECLDHIVLRLELAECHAKQE